MEEPQAPTDVTPVAVEDNSAAESSPAEPTTSTEPTEVVEAEPSSEETPVETEERPKPKPAQRRIQGLLEENKHLKELVGNAPLAPVYAPPQPTLSQQFAGKDYVDPAELDKAADQMVAQRTEAIADLKIRQLEQRMVQEKAFSALERDTEILQRDYPELNPDSDQYNEVLEKKIAENWKRLAVQHNPYDPSLPPTINPGVRLSDVAKDFMEVAQAAAQRGQSQSQSHIADLADVGSIQPNNDSPSEKKFEDLSLAEMEARLRAKGHKI